LIGDTGFEPGRTQYYSVYNKSVGKLPMYVMFSTRSYKEGEGPVYMEGVTIVFNRGEENERRMDAYPGIPYDPRYPDQLEWYNGLDVSEYIQNGDTTIDLGFVTHVNTPPYGWQYNVWITIQN
jgi:hypothetical protein